jgi:hypothetical protein
MLLRTCNVLPAMLSRAPPRPRHYTVQLPLPTSCFAALLHGTCRSGSLRAAPFCLLIFIYSHSYYICFNNNTLFFFFYLLLRMAAHTLRQRKLK